jgi:putative endonuclease
MFFAYVLENSNKKRYTGSTDNLEERLSFHNDNSPEKAKFHRTTYKRGPWEIVFKKSFETQQEALEFERFLKTGIGRRWLEGARHGG